MTLSNSAFCTVNYHTVGPKNVVPLFCSSSPNHCFIMLVGHEHFSMGLESRSCHCGGRLHLRDWWKSTTSLHWIMSFWNTLSWAFGISSWAICSPLWSITCCLLSSGPIVGPGLAILVGLRLSSIIVLAWAFRIYGLCSIVRSVLGLVGSPLSLFRRLVVSTIILSLILRLGGLGHW